MQQQPIPIRQTTLRDFTAIVFRRKGVILTVFLAALMTVIALNATTEPSYISSTRLLVSRGVPESVFNTRIKMLSWEEELNSEIEVLRSSTLGERAQKILRDNGAVDSNGQPIRFNPTSVDPTTTGKASVLVVNYTAADAVHAQEALRALTRAYMDWRSMERSLPYVESFFREELEAVRDRLSEWEQRRADFMAEEGIVHIRTERESLLRQRDDAASQRTHARTQLADYTARLEAVQGLQEERRLDGDVEIFGLGDAEFNDESILFNLRKELSTRRGDYFEKKSRLTEGHPEVQSALSVVNHLEKQFDIEIENYVRFLDARAAVTRARLASLAATIRTLDEELYGLPDKEARLAQYDRIIEALQTDFETLVDRQINAKVQTTGRQEWRVILLQPASEGMPQRTRDYVRMALVPLFAVLIGLALAFIIDGLDHSIKDASDAEDHLEVPVLGSVSKIR